MGEFDFEAAEEIFTSSLRDRAEVLWAEESGECKRELITAAQETIHEILGEADGTDVTVHLLNACDGGSVELVVDNIRFRVEISFKNAETTRALKMKVNYTWESVKTLLEVGRLLSTHPCYAVKPEDAPPEPRVPNSGLSGGTLADGRGSQ